MSMYGTLYQVKRAGEKDFSSFSFQSCFSGHYTSIQYYDNFDIYVLDDYNIHSWTFSYAGGKTNTEEVKEYAAYLQKMGFKFELSRVKINITESMITQKDIEVWKFHVNVKDNSNIVNMILMNAIRYLYETEYKFIVSTFLLLARGKSRTCLFNKFCIAHAKQYCNSGHSLTNIARTLMGLYTPQEFKKEILDNQTIFRNSGIIRKLSKQLNEVDKQILEKAYNKGEAKEIIKTYQDLYGKYK